MKTYLKQSLYLLDSQAKRAIPFLILAFLFSSLLDVIGIGFIGLFLGLLTNPDFFLQKFPSVLSFVQEIPQNRLIVIAGLLIIGAFIFKAMIALLIQNKIVFFGHLFSVRLKSRLMAAYQAAPFTYHLQKNSAYLLSRIQENISAYINNVLLPTCTLVSSAIITTVILSFLLIFQFIPTVLLITLFVLVGGSYDLFAKRRLNNKGKETALLSSEIIKTIHHGLHGLTEIRVLGHEHYFLHSLNAYSSRYAHAQAVTVALQQTPRYLIENAMAIFIVVLCLGGMAAGFQMSSVLAIIGMFVAAGARLLPTVTQLITALNQVRGSYHHMCLIYQELCEVHSLIASEATIKISFSEKTKLPFTHFALNQVSYQYPNAIQGALKQVNIHVTKGQSIGLVGPSGAGKSTLVNLILGFLAPQEGSLLVNDKPIANIREWLNNFAYIPQAIFLLDDTLCRNVAFGIPDHEIDHERMQNAIHMAQLSEVVEQLPEGLNTLLGENGVRLSGGQRQRVALARAFYHERDILVMDEATSALDNETEQEVIHTIKRLKGSKTLIVIAHRLSTVAHCDVLYRLEKGHVVSVGTFKDVIGET